MTTGKRESELQTDEEFCERCAHILGPMSAAAQAIAETARLRSLGYPVEIKMGKGRWMLVRPKDSCDANG